MKVPKKSKKQSPSIHSDQKHECKNCGHLDSGLYCSNCGQHFADVNKPLKEIFLDIVGIFSLDASIFNTLGPFLFKPGFLSREFLEGRRKKYLSPVRLYLFLSVIFFFVAGKATKYNTDDPDRTSFRIENDSTLNDITDSLSIHLSNNNSLSINSVLDSVELDSTTIQKTENGQDAISRIAEEEALFKSNFLKNMSYALFLLMPLFALILKLLYIRRKRFYIEHLIFSINMHSFSLFILTIVVLLQLIFKENDILATVFFLLIPVYLILGMMRFYRQGFFKVLFKSLLLIIIYSILFVATLTGIVLLTVVLF